MTDEQIAAAFIANHPDADPQHNPELRSSVNAPGYVDRGLWGPLGGANGTLSGPWLDQWKRALTEAPSEVALMTLVTPPESENEDENAAIHNAVAMKADMDVELADRRAMEPMSEAQRASYIAAKYPGVDYADPLGGQK